MPPVRPTVQLKIVDTDHLFYSWRWEHDLGAIQNIMVPGDTVWPVVDELARALPTPLPGETVNQALDRSLNGPLTDPGREFDLATRLARALIPYRLAHEMNTYLEQGVRPHVRIQPSHATGQVPWEALRVDEGERFITNADMSVLPPATVRNAPERRVSAWRPDGEAVAVLDPKIPGAGVALGSVLGPQGPDLAARLGLDRSAFHRSDQTRDTVEPLLADASRFLYVGHVTTSAHGLDARLHLSCGPGTTGRAAAVAGHRPLTAADIVLGHRPDTPRAWRMPNRVAFIACESGGEVRFAEPVGLVAAAIHTGAQYVTATRWTLPTDAGMRRFAPAPLETPVIPDVVAAVDDAHRSPDPVASLSEWQRTHAAAWESEGRLEHSPLIWAAFGTAFG